VCPSQKNEGLQTSSELIRVHIDMGELLETLGSASLVLERPILALDLDETLVHVTQLPRNNSEFSIRVGRRRFHVQVRPGAVETLCLLQRHYDLFIFTASNKDYADKIIDHAFPFIPTSHRLYADSCVPMSGYRVKDLRLLGYPRRQVVMIDDLFGSAMLQPQNVVVVPPWLGDTDDIVFESILPVLAAASSAYDVVGELGKLLGQAQSSFPDMGIVDNS